MTKYDYLKQINIFTQLADIVRTTRGIVIRVLAAFKKEKSIELEKSNIIITRLDKIKQWHS